MTNSMSVDTVDLVYTVDMVYIVDMVYAVGTFLYYLNSFTLLQISSTYDYIYCSVRYWNGQMHF